MKKIILSSAAALSMFAMAVVTVSCDSEQDLAVNNPNQAKLEESWAEKFGSIDPDQTWSMVGTAKAEMSVQGLNGLANYQLELYTDNPIASASTAKLIASQAVQTDASGSADASFTVDITKGQTVLYAGYVDSKNRRNVKPVAVIDGVITANFGTETSSASKALTRASSTGDGVEIPTVANPLNEVNAKLDQAKEVSAANANDNRDGSENNVTVLKITGNWSGNIGVLPSEGAAARTLYVSGTWTLGGGEQKLGGNGLIVVEKGGKIVIPSGSSLQSVNGGRIVVLEGGTIEGDGGITFCNGSGDSYNYNAGTINIGSMNNNGGRVFNYAIMNIKELQGGAGNSTYINHGNMTVDHSTYGSTSSNARILTDCSFEVKNNLCCRILKMGNPSSVTVGGNLLMSGSNDGTSDAAEIVMDQNAYLSVAGGVALNNVSIVGPTVGHAVCEFGQIGDPTGAVATNYTTSWTTGSEQVVKGYVINNLYISIDKTETISNYYGLTPYGKFIAVMMNGRLYNVGQDSNNNYQSYPIYREGVQAGNGNAVIVNKGQANIYISSKDCESVSDVKTGEYVPVPGDATTLDANGFIIACEDLGSTKDVDFNDAIYNISHVTGTTTMTITPLAAGGTMPITLYYDGQEIGEIHNMLGVTNTTQMVNTTGDITNKGGSKTITVDENWSISANLDKFYVSVTGSDEKSQIIYQPTQGKAPFIITVPADWYWPKEKVNIEDAYPNFKKWSQDATYDTWTQTYDEDKVVKR